jgi:hypothetical protein
MSETEDQTPPEADVLASTTVQDHKPQAVPRMSFEAYCTEFGFNFRSPANRACPVHLEARTSYNRYVKGEWKTDPPEAESKTHQAWCRSLGLPKPSSSSI